MRIKTVGITNNLLDGLLDCSSNTKYGLREGMYYFTAHNDWIYFSGD